MGSICRHCDCVCGQAEVAYHGELVSRCIPAVTLVYCVLESFGSKIKICFDWWLHGGRISCL